MFGFGKSCQTVSQGRLRVPSAMKESCCSPPSSDQGRPCGRRLVVLIGPYRCLALLCDSLMVYDVDHVFGHLLSVYLLWPDIYSDLHPFLMQLFVLQFFV